MLLWLGRLTHGKDPLTLVEALARLRDLDWTARLVGPDTLDETLSRRVRDRIAQAGLTGRVEVAGPLRLDLQPCVVLLGREPPRRRTADVESPF